MLTKHRRRGHTNKVRGMSDDLQHEPPSNPMPRWVWWIGAIILLNVLSQVFHWGFIFY
jgi:hypothetical protein